MHGTEVPMYSSTCDWGRMGNPRFDRRQLEPIKKACRPRCCSTLNHYLALRQPASLEVNWQSRICLVANHVNFVMDKDDIIRHTDEGSDAIELSGAVQVSTLPRKQ